MTQLEMRQILAQVEAECDVVIADSPELLRECCRLRHQVFCLETEIFKPGSDDQETDDFDKYSHHILLIHRESGQAVGTTRIIPASNQIGVGEFPMTRAFAPGILRTLPSQSTGEISRFAISKELRMRCGASMMVRLGLMQGIVRLSGELGLTHWCAIMEPKLVRMFRMSGIDFHELGPPVQYFGWRSPVYAEIKMLSDLLKVNNWQIWNYVSLGGTLWNREIAEPTRLLEFA
jgi:N-acyl-L-homoserine lactone synthetase